MLYSEALRQFVHRSLGISSLGGTQHFTGQPPEKPDLTEVNPALNKEWD